MKWEDNNHHGKIQNQKETRLCSLLPLVFGAYLKNLDLGSSVDSSVIRQKIWGKLTQSSSLVSPQTPERWGEGAKPEDSGLVGELAHKQQLKTIC